MSFISIYKINILSLYNKYLACKSQKNWENYRKQRNICTNIRRKSVNQYFIERCAGAKIKGFLAYQ